MKNHNKLWQTSSLDNNKAQYLWLFHKSCVPLPRGSSVLIDTLTWKPVIVCNYYFNDPGSTSGRGTDQLLFSLICSGYRRFTNLSYSVTRKEERNMHLHDLSCGTDNDKISLLSVVKKGCKGCCNYINSTNIKQYSVC